MENMNKKRKFKPGQGKTQQQYTDSTRFAWYGVVGMVILLFLASLLGGCTTIKECHDKNYVITEWDGDREIKWYSTNKSKTDSIIPNGISCKCLECTNSNWGPQ